MKVSDIEDNISTRRSQALPEIILPNRKLSNVKEANDVDMILDDGKMSLLSNDVTEEQSEKVVMKMADFEIENVSSRTIPEIIIAPTRNHRVFKTTLRVLHNFDTVGETLLNCWWAGS